MVQKRFVLGIELGSTRIKAVAIDRNHAPVSAGDHTWASRYENGVWTYSLDEVWAGLKARGRGQGTHLHHGRVRHDARVSGL